MGGEGRMRPAPEARKGSAGHRRGLLLLAAALWLVALRLHALQQPLERDITTYALMAERWLDGDRLYAEVWDQKPPLLHALFAVPQLLFGCTPFAVWVLGAAADLGAMFFLMGAARRGCGATGAVLVGAVWALVCSNPLTWADTPNAETLINLFLAGSIFFALGKGVKGPVAASFLIALSTAVKPVTWVFIPVACFWIFRATRGAPVTARRAALVALPFFFTAAVWGGVLAWMALEGSVEEFVYAVFRFNLTYMHAARMQVNAWPWVRWAVAGVAGPAALFAPALWRAARGRDEALLRTLAGTLAAVAAVLTTGRLYPHYFTLLLPWVTMLGVHFGAVRLASNKRISGVASLLLAFGVLGGSTLWTLARSPEDVSRFKYGGTFVRVRELGEWAGRNVPEGATLVAWSQDTGIAFYAQRRLGTRLLDIFPLLNALAMGDRRLVDEWEEDALRADPVLVVIQNIPDFPPGLAPRFFRKLTTECRSLGDFYGGRYTLYWRKDAPPPE